MKKVGLKVGRRLPEAICFKLRHHGGGAHSTPRGKKGYNRGVEKHHFKKEVR